MPLPHSSIPLNPPFLKGDEKKIQCIFPYKQTVKTRLFIFSAFNQTVKPPLFVFLLFNQTVKPSPGFRWGLNQTLKPCPGFGWAFNQTVTGPVIIKIIPEGLHVCRRIL